MMLTSNLIKGKCLSTLRCKLKINMQRDTDFSLFFMERHLYSNLKYIKAAFLMESFMNKEKERERDRKRETDRQTDRQIERERES